MAIYSWFTHWKWVDFPVRYVSLPEGRWQGGALPSSRNPPSWMYLVYFVGWSPWRSNVMWLWPGLRMTWERRVVNLWLIWRHFRTKTWTMVMMIILWMMMIILWTSNLLQWVFSWWWWYGDDGDSVIRVLQGEPTTRTAAVLTVPVNWKSEHKIWASQTKLDTSRTLDSLWMI